MRIASLLGLFFLLAVIGRSEQALKAEAYFSEYSPSRTVRDGDAALDLDIKAIVIWLYLTNTQSEVLRVPCRVETPHGESKDHAYFTFVARFPDHPAPRPIKLPESDFSIVTLAKGETTMIRYEALLGHEQRDIAVTYRVEPQLSKVYSLWQGEVSTKATDIRARK